MACVAVVSEPPKKPTPTPCNPSPCGANAVCREQSGSAICQCLPEYFGDARQGCKPECVLNSDCASTQVCVNQKCRDPCPGLCGNNAECRVVNHFATCYCPQGHTGNPLESCKVIPVEGNAFLLFDQFLNVKTILNYIKKYLSSSETNRGHRRGKM